MAIRDGLKYNVANNMFPLIIEIDFLAMQQIIEEKWDIPWNIHKEVHRINVLRANGQHQIKHGLRERNSVADCFTNFVVSFAEERLDLKFCPNANFSYRMTTQLSAQKEGIEGRELQLRTD
ncbi:hypothetical protein HAX54_004090, partial [Datura stramonium]|nr:hypothetical protein [Datura stramonium]